MDEGAAGALGAPKGSVLAAPKPNGVCVGAENVPNAGAAVVAVGWDAEEPKANTDLEASAWVVAGAAAAAAAPNVNGVAVVLVAGADVAAGPPKENGDDLAGSVLPNWNKDGATGAAAGADAAAVAGAAAEGAPNGKVDADVAALCPNVKMAALEEAGAVVVEVVAAGVAAVAPKVKSDEAGADVVVVETAVPVNEGAEVVVAAALGCPKPNMDVAPVVVAGLNKDNDGVEVAPKENVDGAAAAVVVAAGSSNVVFLAFGCSSVAVLPPAADVRGPLKEKGAAVPVEVSAGLPKANIPAGAALGGWLNERLEAEEASVDTGRDGFLLKKSRTLPVLSSVAGLIPSKLSVDFNDCTGAAPKLRTGIVFDAVVTVVAKPKPPKELGAVDAGVSSSLPSADSVFFVESTESCRVEPTPNCRAPAGAVEV